MQKQLVVQKRSLLFIRLQTLQETLKIKYNSRIVQSIALKTLQDQDITGSPTQKSRKMPTRLWYKIKSKLIAHSCFINELPFSMQKQVPLSGQIRTNFFI